METTLRERIFFQNAEVKVTSSQLLVNGMSYALESINSVSKYISQPNRTWPILGIMAGLALLLPAETRVAGAVLIIANLIWLVMLKKKYAVKINYHAGQEIPYSSSDEAIIQGIINAINRARE